MRPFPDEFVWGAATAAYQVEGAAAADGRGPSVWDAFSEKAGAVWKGQSGEIACDHYHRYPEDIALMRQIGLQAYRFSISWSRVLPEGVGKPNQAGLDFYGRLVDGLLNAGITPYVTLFHWDFPLALHRRGGWRNRESADWFADYAALVVQKLSDRVGQWITLNEPQCFMGLGHLDGKHAPGEKLPVGDVISAGHHVLLAHGRAVKAIRATTRQSCQIGYAPVGIVKVPSGKSPSDVDAARASMFGVERSGVWNNAWWLDPVVLGHYPEAGLAAYGKTAALFEDDLPTIAEPIDFIGTNIYSAERVRAGARGEPEELAWPLGHPMTGFDWPVVPEALYWGPRFLYERYKLPIVITENGVSCRDWVSMDQRVHDPQRVDFLKRYLLALGRAVEEGVPVKGYFQWSLLDNFEWAEGYKERFGLVFVDYATQTRILKDSARWYRDVIASRGASLSAPESVPALSTEAESA